MVEKLRSIEEIERQLGKIGETGEKREIEDKIILAIINQAKKRTHISRR
jgi:hypothetical protein